MAKLTNVRQIVALARSERLMASVFSIDAGCEVRLNER
jgi:hypothetical protein